MQTHIIQRTAKSESNSWIIQAGCSPSLSVITQFCSLGPPQGNLISVDLPGGPERPSFRKGIRRTDDHDVNDRNPMNGESSVRENHAVGGGSLTIRRMPEHRCDERSSVHTVPEGRGGTKERQEKLCLVSWPQAFDFQTGRSTCLLVLL